MNKASIPPFVYLYVLFYIFFGYVSSDLLAATETTAKKTRIFIVSSYDRNYLWSQSTNRGMTAAMFRYGYIDNDQQISEFNSTDHIETSKAILQKAWMNTKRRNSTGEIAEATLRIMRNLHDFKPDLVLLGDDNAANYVGNQLLDTDIPVVFWGINGLPIKYGLVDSMDRPGHNVTGVWQAGYYKESLDLLKRLVPSATRFAVLACDSITARASVKQIQSLAQQGKLPLQLVETIMTNSFTEFKNRTLETQDRVDAFFVLNHDTMRDDHGEHVDMLTVGKWYLTNIHKPEASHEDQFVREGMLLTANDCGFNQAFRAFEMAYDILEQGLNPGLMRTVTPSRGPLMINRKRAEMLGIRESDFNDHVDVIVDEAVALDDSH